MLQPVMLDEETLKPAFCNKSTLYYITIYCFFYNFITNIRIFLSSLTYAAAGGMK